MKEKNFWQFIKSQFEKDGAVILMVVVESENSSPGRAGFKMAVAKNKKMIGSIGGGMMEHNLVEDASLNLNNNSNIISIKKLYHVGDSREDSSGMICSGAQTILTLALQKKDILTIDKIISALEDKKKFAIKFDQTGLSFGEKDLLQKKILFTFTDEQNWFYQESITEQDTIYIIGGGHVGLALSKVMSFLDFYVVVIDNRDYLPTIEMNALANEKIIINYDDILNYLIEGNNSYVAIVSHSFKSDSLVLQKVITHNYKYIGMMGSKAKVKEVLGEMKMLGFTEEQIKNIHAPIGIEITSETPEEIAISIAAEIIKVRNSSR